MPCDRARRVEIPRRQSRTRGLVVPPLAGLLAMIAVVVTQSGAAAGQASTNYQGAQHRLYSDLQRLQQQGYTAQDLKPITDSARQIEGAAAPIWVGSRAGFYQQQEQAMEQLRAQTRTLQASLLEQARSAADGNLASLQTQIANDQQLGVEGPQLAPLQAQYQNLVTKESQAQLIGDYRAVTANAAPIADQVYQLGVQQQAENAAIQVVAQDLINKDGGNLDAIRADGQAALTGGRNEASVAAYEAKAGRFAALDLLMNSYNRMERYATKLGAATVADVATGAGATQRYSGQVHQTVMQGLGPKHIVVSFQAQHVWAYENGQLVMNTPVTTGVRGVTDYGTDFGPMKVLFQQHPFKFHSPWPQGSQYWYPDTWVQWTTFFTWSGESFHDAPWQPDSTLGPGSQYDSGTRSHGCIHLTFDLAAWMFGWASTGTPVDVYPGDGQPVAAQLAEMTTDDQGNPLNPA